MKQSNSRPSLMRYLPQPGTPRLSKTSRIGGKNRFDELTSHAQNIATLCLQLQECKLHTAELQYIKQRKQKADEVGVVGITMETFLMVFLASGPR